MMHKKTSRELLEEANELDRQVAAMDEHRSRSFQGMTSTGAELAALKRSRDRLAASAALKRRQAAERE